MSDRPDITTNALAMLEILEHAESEGMPLPFSASSSRFGVDLLLSLDHLTQWSLWVEQPIDSHHHAVGASHSVHAEILGHRVRLAATTTAAAAVA